MQKSDELGKGWCLGMAGSWEGAPGPQASPGSFSLDWGTAELAHLTGPAAMTSVVRDGSTVTSMGELGVRGEPWCEHVYTGPPSPAPTTPTFVGCLEEAPVGCW